MINVPGRGYRFGLTLRDAQAAGRPLTIASLPSELRQIADVSDALGLLPLADDAHG